MRSRSLSCPAGECCDEFVVATDRQGAGDDETQAPGDERGSPGHALRGIERAHDQHDSEDGDHGTEHVGGDAGQLRGDVVA